MNTRLTSQAGIFMWYLQQYIILLFILDKLQALLLQNSNYSYFYLFSGHFFYIFRNIELFLSFSKLPVMTLKTTLTFNQ